MATERIPPSLADAVLTLTGSLLDLAAERSDVRQALRTISTALSSELGPSHGEHAAPRHAARAVTEKVLSVSGGERRVVSLAETDRGDRARERELREVELDLVARRSAWKARACRLAIERRAAGEPTAELDEREQKLRDERESLPDCFPWMLDGRRRLPDDERLEQIAAAYDNVALAASEVRRLGAQGVLDKAPPPELLYLLAEAQSALLGSLGAVDIRGDSDQRDLFLWLKDQTTRFRIYVDRHMRLDDPADFRIPEGLERRLKELSQELSARAAAARSRSRLLGKVRFHASKLDPNQPPEGYDWDAIVGALDEWLGEGLAAVDSGLDRLLEPHLARLGEEDALPEPVQRLLLARRELAGEVPVRPGVVGRAARLLTGRRAALLAGEPAQDLASTKRELEETLLLEDLRLVELPAEVGTERLEQEIDREDLDLVLIATRLTPEAYAEFKRICFDHQKPFVRLPGKVDAGQVAHQVLRQVGRRLGDQALSTGSR